jgi:hypothetical protein
MEQEEELHSFPYDTSIPGTEHHYHITQKEHHYGIEQDGVVIAAVQTVSGSWKQVSGEPLSRELLNSICAHIQSHH